MITSVSESELNEDGVAEEVTEVIMSTIGALVKDHDLHLQGAGSHLTEMIFAALLGAISSILMFLATGKGGDTMGVTDHLRLVGHPVAPYLAQ